MNQGAEYRSPGVSTPVNAVQFKDRSFIRLQDVSFSYSLPNSLMDKINIQNLKFFLSGKNLITLTDWDGWDPETGQGLAISSDGLPVMKSITFGLDISF